MQCPEATGAAASNQIQVNCQPTDSGEYMASLDLMTNDDNESELSFGLLCAGSTDSLFIDGFELQEGD